MAIVYIIQTIFFGSEGVDVYRKQTVTIAVILSGIISGCAGWQPTEPSGELACRQFFDRLDDIVDDAERRDVQAARINDFPNLRVNRFLASFRDSIIDKGALRFWYGLLQSLDMDARHLEIDNVSKISLAKLGQLSGDAGLINTLERCGSILRVSDNIDQNRMNTLLKRAEVADDYSDLKRVLGVYFLSHILVSRGVEELHENIDKRFQQPLELIPVEGELVRFFPPAINDVTLGEDVASILQTASENPLGIPLLKKAQKEKLFAKFAPIWEIDIATNNDRIGTPYWQTENRLDVGISEPRTYRHLSYGRFDGEILIQLNYVIWFPSRPVTGLFDLFGGRLDGITWRVTLGTDGHPVFYDSMHNCGCYHLFFPSNGIRLRPLGNQTEEPIRSIEADFVEGAPVVVRIASGTHYIQRVYSLRAAQTGIDYLLSDYTELRSLSLPRGSARRSMFNADSLVPGTERKERWILWPMGISSPGAMRQWGHHATAFVGRRHFDDPDLFDRYFARKK